MGLGRSQGMQVRAFWLMKQRDAASTLIAFSAICCAAGRPHAPVACALHPGQDWKPLLHPLASAFQLRLALCLCPLLGSWCSALHDCRKLQVQGLFQLLIIASPVMATKSHGQNSTAHLYESLRYTPCKFCSYVTVSRAQHDPCHLLVGIKT